MKKRHLSERARHLFVAVLWHCGTRDGASGHHVDFSQLAIMMDVPEPKLVAAMDELISTGAARENINSTFTMNTVAFMEAVR